MDIITKFYVSDESISFDLQIETVCVNFLICAEGIDKKKFKKWRQLMDVIENGGEIEGLEIRNCDSCAYLSCTNDELIISQGDDVLDNITFNLNKCRDNVFTALKEIFDDSSMWKFY